MQNAGRKTAGVTYPANAVRSTIQKNADKCIFSLHSRPYQEGGVSLPWNFQQNFQSASAFIIFMRIIYSLCFFVICILKILFMYLIKYIGFVSSLCISCFIHLFATCMFAIFIVYCNFAALEIFPGHFSIFMEFMESITVARGRNGEFIETSDL